MPLMQHVGHYHNLMPFTIIIASICGLIQIALTWQVVKLRMRFKQDVGIIDNDVYHRRNGALTNFTAHLPIFLILYALAENNHVNCGLLFFFGGFFILVRLVHIYSLYTFETKTKSYRLRILGMMGTFFTIIALAGLNLLVLYEQFSPQVY